MAVWRGADCPQRGAGLTHTQNTSKRPDGSCIHCFEQLTDTQPSTPATPASKHVGVDDRLGRQLDYEKTQCPARGVALSHYLPDRVAGPCLHCHRDVVHALDHEAMMSRPAAWPDYDSVIRSHGASAIMAYRGHRPVLSARHAWAARLIMRSIVAERDDPAPDFLAS